jgi:hypothetical protein
MRMRSVECIPVLRRWGHRLLGRRSGLGLLALPLLGLALAGCGGLEPVPTQEAVTDPSQLYMSLQLEQRAINLSTAAGYNTVQLTATPYDGRGEVMSGLPAATFRVAHAGDSTILRVTSEGLATALQPGSEIAVVAELVVPGPGGSPVRHTDTAHVGVQALDPPPVLDRLSIYPVPSDTAVWHLRQSDISDAFGGILSLLAPPVPVLKPLALDATTGQPISGLVIEYVLLDPVIATVDQWTGSVKTRFPGRVRTVVRTTAYGVTQADTALSTVTWPVEDVVRIGAGGAIIEPSELWIVPNGVVLWQNRLRDSVDVTFEDPTNVEDPANDPANGTAATKCSFLESFGNPKICDAGDVLLGGFNPDDENSFFNSFTYRQFPVPGVYRFRSTRTGATGRIVVTDEPPTSAAVAP